ncbi:MAG: PilZ domain-containing protein [Thermodesulfovibrionia bacterium]|nr:PilZ domain-containing protein [Thermodesulfovibrionia bacterium]
MEKRTFERVPVKLSARLVYNEVSYPGVVVNLSNKGVFISTRLRVPEGSVVEIDMPLKDKVLIAPFKVKRNMSSPDFREYNELNGLGCEVMNVTSCFEDYIKSLKTTH